MERDDDLASMSPSPSPPPSKPFKPLSRLAPSSAAAHHRPGRQREEAENAPNLNGRSRTSTNASFASHTSALASASSDAIASASDWGAEAAISSDDSFEGDVQPLAGNQATRDGSPTEGLQLVMGGTAGQTRVADVLVEKRPNANSYGSWDLSRGRLGSALAGGASALAATNIASSRRKGSSSLPASYRRRGSPGPVAASKIRSASPALVEDPPPLFMWRLFFRFELVAEVGLLTCLITFATYRLHSPSLPRTSPAAVSGLPSIPITPLIALIVLLPVTTLLRRWPRRYLHYPFTDERGYRESSQADDGLACGIAVPVLLASSSLWDCMSASTPHDIRLDGVRDLTDVWESQRLASAWIHRAPTAQDTYNAVLQARTSLFVLTIINAYVLLFNLLLARTLFKIAYLPENNTKRFFGAAALSATVSGSLFLIFQGCEWLYDASPYVAPTEVACGTFLYQMSMYSISRLVRRGFTLGELSITSMAGYALCLEISRLASARWDYTAHTAVPMLFRAPTPLLVFQHALIPGVFLCGFCLSPLLVLSRHIASKPLRKLRWPQHKERNRRLLTAGVIAGLAVVVGLVLSPWAGWALGGRISFAWIWAIRFIVFGGDGVDGMDRGDLHGWARWKRCAISAYWLAVIVAAVGGWTTRLVRSRKIHVAQQMAPMGASSSKAGAEGAREEKRKHVSLDLRRKFFHALAVLMFVPGIALDPAFTSLALSVAFAIFTFAEYARYFALHPIGGPIHVFFHEFTDAKDSGPVILSHFYLLTGCAGGIWLEGKGIKRFTGVLALGVGDAMASVIGRRVGGPRWTTSGSKTIVGTFAFVLSIATGANLLRWSGFVRPFPRIRFICATLVAAMMEAVSLQNDNLTVPLVMWSVLSLLEV